MRRVRETQSLISAAIETGGERGRRSAPSRRRSRLCPFENTNKRFPLFPVCRQRKQKTHAVPDQVQIQEEEFRLAVTIQVGAPTREGGVETCCKLGMKHPECLVAGAAAADRGGARIPETGDVPRARTRNDPETGTGGREPGPGETAHISSVTVPPEVVDCETNPHTETERKRNPVGGDPEPHPKATAQPEGHTAGIGDLTRLVPEARCRRDASSSAAVVVDSPQETQEEPEHQQVPQKETLQVSVASEVRRPCAREDRAFIHDERCFKFHLNPSVVSLLSSSPADTRRRRRRIRKGNEIARLTRISAAKSASSPARRRRTRIKTKTRTRRRRRSGRGRGRGSERRNQRARKETSRSDQTTLPLSGGGCWSVLKLPSPHRSPEITMKRSKVMTARRSGRRGSTPTTRRCRLSPAKATARPAPTRQRPTAPTTTTTWTSAIRSVPVRPNSETSGM